MRRTTGRRAFLRAVAVGATGSVLAGCTGGSGGDGRFDGWLSNTGNYESVADRTGESEVAVTVGASGNNGPYAFAPAAVRVATGTRVVWTWTGNGSHDVVAADGAFESDRARKQGYTFSHTFDAAGTYRYYCTPHKPMGMKGVVVVE